MAGVKQDLSWRLQRTEDLDIDPWHETRGAVIAGQVSNLSGAHLQSFLRYRADLATVTILGYDEVLERLKALHTMLKSPPTSVEGAADGGTKRGSGAVDT